MERWTVAELVEELEVERRRRRELESELAAIRAITGIALRGSELAEPEPASL